MREIGVRRLQAGHISDHSTVLGPRRTVMGLRSVPQMHGFKT